MARFIIVAALFLAGCAPTVTGSTPRSVTVGNVTNFTIGKAQVIAEQECLRYGKHAIHIGTVGNHSIAYGCVE